MKKVAVILAGGSGERFWPKSTKDMPKQFLSLTTDGKTMIQHTVSRLTPLIDTEDIFIITNKDYKDIVKKQLPQILEKNILLEPIAKNTAPSIGLAATHIRKRYQEAVMVVLPSDHLVRHNEMFVETLKDAIEVAYHGNTMVTIGITPSYPETGYGYIKIRNKKQAFGNTKAYEVERFVEKPNAEKAKEYIVSGQYLWNSGIYIWKVSTILKNFDALLHDTYIHLMTIEESIGNDNHAEVLQKQFVQCISNSIDYAIMEKASHIYTIPGNFGWDDVGNWLALERINKTDVNGNVITGNVVASDVHSCIVQANKKMVVAIGVDDLVIVDTEDALLVCHKNNVQDIKNVIKQVELIG